MKTIKTGHDWLDRLMPEGLPIHTSTIISGPGGSGKPLLGDIFVSSWLKAGGSVIFMSLQYPSRDFIATGLDMIGNLDLDDYTGRFVFIYLDVTIPEMEEPNRDGFRANLLKPDVWDAAIEKASLMVSKDGPGILVFGSALNLLLFSPTYADRIFTKIITKLKGDKQYTYIFSVSTSANKKQIDEMEKAADNLIMTRSEKEPFRLFMQIIRLQGVGFLDEEVEVPIPPQALSHIKKIAENSRKRIIPQISKI